MADFVNVAVDAMGGDNAPVETVKGAIEAVNADKRVKVYLVGREPDITAELKKYEYDAERVEIVHTEEVIEMAEPPVMAIRKKKNSSIVKAMNMVKNGECDALVTAGSTGAFLVGGQVIVEPLKKTVLVKGQKHLKKQRLKSQLKKQSNCKGRVNQNGIFIR